MGLNRRELADHIERTAKVEFEGTLLRDILRSSPNWRFVTRKIKEVFGNLGNRLEYHVAASGYPNGTQGEWLYDMVWFASLDGLLSQQAMVLESEFKPGGSVLNAGEVDDDFMKLVQARAEVRIWLALVPNPDLTIKHIKNCKRQAYLFAGAMPGDTYIFIIYDWTTEITLVERFEVGIPDQAQISI